MTNGQKNQLANESGSPVAAEALGLTRYAIAPSSSSSTDGMSPPSAAAQIVFILGVLRGT